MILLQITYYPKPLQITIYYDTNIYQRYHDTCIYHYKLQILHLYILLQKNNTKTTPLYTITKYIHLYLLHMHI